MNASTSDEGGQRASASAVATWLAELQDASFERGSAAIRSAYPPERRLSGQQIADYLDRWSYAIASSSRPDGRAHAAPTLFTVAEESFWLPTLGNAIRVKNVKAHPWVALSVVEGQHDTHAAVLTEGPCEVLASAPPAVTQRTQERNQGGPVDWATAWLRMTPQRLFSFAEAGWRG